MTSETVRCRWFERILLASPVNLLVVSAIASLIGMDSDGKWGAFQSGVFWLGLVGTLAVAGIFAAKILDSREYSAGRPMDPIEEIKNKRPASKLRWLLPGLMVALVELFYIFFVSVGHWYPWPDSTNYYDQQAEAFLEGRLDIPVAPDPALRELEDPYDPQERGAIPILFDASYYAGKYYFYWGPTPAILSAGWKLLTGMPVGDEHVTFLAINVLFIFSSLILLQLRARYFPSLPSWLLSLGVGLVGIVHPLLWILNWPTIYPAAIASGQAFLVAGIFIALPILQYRDQSKWRYLLVGLLWALAVSSRITVSASLSILAGVLVFRSSWISDVRGSWKGSLPNLTLFFIPLIGSAVLLAVLNYLRFGNLLEFGLRFQLSKINTLSLADAGQLFDIRYMVPNFIHYLLAPLRLQADFPFIRPMLSAIDSVRPINQILGVAQVHRVENASGILFSTPALVFCGYLVWEAICAWGPNKGAFVVPAGKLEINRMSGEFFGLMLALITAGLAGFFPILTYFWVTNRFLGDIVPLLSLSAVAGMWTAYSSSSSRRWLGLYIRILLISMVIFSMLVSILLAFTGTFSSFDNRNPELWRWLQQLFSI